MRRPLAALAVLAPLAVGLASSACQDGTSPTGGVVERCALECQRKAARSCSQRECVRGCEFILDRLVENEGAGVIACVGRTPRRCTDVVWAECAARVGVHADGGPPAPPPPQEEE